MKSPTINLDSFPFYLPSPPQPITPTYTLAYTRARTFIPKYTSRKSISLSKIAYLFYFKYFRLKANVSRFDFST